MLSCGESLGFRVKILMHICFQCSPDYSLWTKPVIWLLFWKMLKKTSDSNNLHSEWGTWCSQILCDGSCSLVQHALNRRHQQACHHLSVQSQVPWAPQATFQHHQGTVWEQSSTCSGQVQLPHYRWWESGICAPEGVGNHLTGWGNTDKLHISVSNPQCTVSLKTRQLKTRD